MSMQGTVLFVFGIIAAVSAVVTRSQWLTAVAAILLAPGVVMLYRAGKSLD